MKKISKKLSRIRNTAFDRGYAKAEREKNAEIRQIRKQFQNEIDLYDKRDFERIKAHRKKMIRAEKFEKQAFDKLSLASQTLVCVDTISAEAHQQADNLKIKQNNIFILKGHAEHYKNEIEKQREKLLSG